MSKPARSRTDATIDKAVRDHAIQNLAAFVSRGGDDQASSSGYVPLVESEMAKLWKGLFYCESAGANSQVVC
jgi:ribosomal RNA-processing protein 1